MTASAAFLAALLAGGLFTLFVTPYTVAGWTVLWFATATLVRIVLSPFIRP